MRVIIAAAATLLTLAGCIAWWRSSQPALAFAEHDWVMVADISNDVADPMFDGPLFAAFTVGLAQSTRINVLTRPRTVATLRWMGKPPGSRIDEMTAREIALREKARALILCRIFSGGPRYAFSARLEDPRTGDVARLYVETADTPDGVLDAVNRVVYRLRRDLGESRASIAAHNRPVAQAITPSLQALKLYTDGLSLARAGRPAEAIASYREALAYDRRFPLLHAALAALSSNSSEMNREEAQKHYEVAVEGAGRLTDRERILFQAAYAGAAGREAEGISLYSEFLKVYPDAYDVRYNLGTLLMRRGRFEEAGAQFAEVLRLWPGSAAAHVNLATCRTLAGRPGEALAQWEQAFTLEPQWRTAGDNLTHEYGFTLAASGQAGKARELFEAALAKRGPASNMLTSLALLDMYEGRHRAAGEHVRQALALGETAGNALTSAQLRQLLAMLAEARGDRAGVLRELDQSAQALSQAAWQTGLNARIGCLYARSGAVSRAEQFLDALRRHASQSGPGESGYLPLLEGQIALARGDYQGATGFLERAAAGRPPELSLGLLAQAYAGTGQAERYVETLEKLVAMPSQALGWEAQECWTEAHAALARAYLERGDRARAATVAGRLADRWKNADGDLPLTRDIATLTAKLQ